MARPKKAEQQHVDLGAPLAYSTKTAAQVIGVGEDLILKSIDGGLLKARRLGGRLLITRRDLESFLSALPEKPTKFTGK